MNDHRNEHHLQSLISIKLICDDEELSKSCEHLLFNPSSFQSAILVNSTDSISSLIKSTGLSFKNINIIHDSKILCPALSFSFYKVKNNDTISIVNAQKNYERQSFKNKNIKIENYKEIVDSKQKSDDEISDFKTDLYRFRIESNHKKFRKLCSSYYRMVDSELLSQSINLTSSYETVLPEKAENPSTDFLPLFN